MRTFLAACTCSWKGPLDKFEDHAKSCYIIDATGHDSRATHSENSVQKANTNGKTNGLGEPRDKTLLELKSALKNVEDMCHQLSVTVQEMNKILHRYTSNVDIINQSISHLQLLHDELNLKVEIQEVKTINGTVVWKVNEVQRRFREARTGKIVSLYSPPFYTSAHGYRLCLRAYLYGDGPGKGTHVSVFLVIMRSEYDDVLFWPFKHRVVISLINLDNPLKLDAAITHKFLPNPQSNSFEKPKDIFNLASGFPQFAPISVLTDSRFVKNDTMYFRVKLEPPNAATSLDDCP
eukprot:Em0014g909a